MKLQKIKLHNYRCFGDGEAVIGLEKLTALIGNNSAGKTTVLSAINKLFSPDASERNLQRGDFHVPKGMDPNHMQQVDMYIEAVFVFDELHEEGETSITGIPPFFESCVVDCPNGLPYLRIRLEASLDADASVNGSIDSNIYFITCSDGETIEDVNRTRAKRSVLDNIRVIYIPAVRDPSKQLRNVSGTMMYQIMNSINWSEATCVEIQSQIEALNNLYLAEKGAKAIKKSVAEKWKGYDSDERYSDAELRFNSMDINDALRRAEVVFQPTVTGKEYSIDEMGDGLRSLFYISLVDSLLDVEEQMRKEGEEEPEKRVFNRKPPLFTIVAVEEPENHIAPHLIGKLISKLKNIANKANSQTVFTSHSTAVVKRIAPSELRYLRMDCASLSTEVHSIILPDQEKLEDQYKYVKEAVIAYPEMYFAKLVVLGEGDTEEIVLKKYFENEVDNLDSAGISVVPLGGAYVNHFWRLLNDLHIPYITLLDLDRERDGGGWGRIKYALKQLIEIGYPGDKLLACKNGVADLDKMHEWPVRECKTMQSWMDLLEGYQVFLFRAT